MRQISFALLFIALAGFAPPGLSAEVTELDILNAILENGTFSDQELQDMDVNGTIERVVSCTTCHEPHNRHSMDNMLWIDNAGSQLCLTCHLK